MARAQTDRGNPVPELVILGRRDLRSNNSWMHNLPMLAKLGSVVLVWSLARLLQPSRKLGRLDAVARLLFAAWQVHAVLAGASAIVLGFTVFELLFAVLQLWPLVPSDHLKFAESPLALEPQTAQSAA